MQPLFSPEGEAALAALLRHRPDPLLAFDFDGTLAPIVSRPGDARVPPSLLQALRLLALRLPLAVVSGRALADLQGRLQLAPCHVVGNHGAEDGSHPAAAARHRAALDALRTALQAQAAALQAAGVQVEDKGLSIALHHRQAADPVRARALIDAVLAPQRGVLRIFGGKQVANAVAADAPDKADAVQALVAGCGAGSALYLGDDVNDEPVFARAPAHWLTVRVGRDGVASKARYVLDSQADVGRLLQRLLVLTDVAGGPGAGPLPSRPTSPSDEGPT